jgi:ATP-dependent Clp protease protease subunit
MNSHYYGEILMTKEEKHSLHSLNDRIEQEILQQRKIFLCGAVDEDSAREVIRKLWYLQSVDKKKPVILVINSPGGSVDAGFAIWDQLKMSNLPIATLVSGLAASMGSVLSLAASPKMRFATPSSRIMIHQPLIGGYIQGQATDLDIQAKEMLKTRTALVKLYSKATGKKEAEIEHAIDRDTWMSAQEAKEYGLLDHLVVTDTDLKKYLS